MWSIVIHITIGVLLMVHGFAHWQITTGWGSRMVAESGVLRSFGLAESAVASLGTALWMVALLGFNAAGIAMFAG